MNKIFVSTWQHCAGVFFFGAAELEVFLPKP